MTATLGSVSLFAYDDDFVAALGFILWSLLAIEGGMGSLWVTLRITLEALAAYEGAFGVTLGLFGNSLGSVWVSVGDFGSLDGRFAMIFESKFGYMKVHFQKHPFSLQILMKLYSSGVNCGSVWVTFGSLLVDEGDFGVT